MRRLLVTIVFILPCVGAWANDGVYYTSGNHLIPYFEKEIQLKKEILRLTRHRDFIKVDVDYTFYNPEQPKRIKVGFEAMASDGEAMGGYHNGAHPYLHDFTVNVNGRVLPFEIAHVRDTTYARHGVINGLTQKEVNQQLEDGYTTPDFFYVYHFDVDFQQGENKIRHTYFYDISGSVDLLYHFDYVLTAANRWANGQIDDFTLIIDMGRQFDEYRIAKTFFGKTSDWELPPRSTALDRKTEEDAYAALFTNDQGGAVQFYIEQGEIIFKKTNFKPTGELFVYSPRLLIGDVELDETFAMPYSVEHQDMLLYNDTRNRNEKFRRILTNLPYARRGLVFKDPFLKDYFEKNVDWYIPDPDLLENKIYLSPKEKLFLKDIKNTDKQYN